MHDRVPAPRQGSALPPLSVLDLSLIVEGGSAGEALRNSLDLARTCEALGYHRYWVAEHHNMDGVASSATAVLVGQIAAVTSRIRVGSGGVMLPNHAPLVIAEQFGTLATLYPGRIDLGLGRSCADEITIGNDAPDGARWLGLDRRTFLAVACVRQGDLLLVRQNGQLIQDHLQRGAATGGADETAAVALERIDQFRKEQVGASHREIATVLFGEKVVKEERMLRGTLGRLRDVRQGPDGYIYLLTDEANGVLARIEPAER